MMHVDEVSQQLSAMKSSLEGVAAEYVDTYKSCSLKSSTPTQTT